MTDEPSRRTGPTWPTIGILIAPGATLFLIGVASVKSMWNILDYGDGILAGAAGTLMLLIGLVLLMIRAVRLGMRQ